MIPHPAAPLPARTDPGPPSRSSGGLIFLKKNKESWDIPCKPLPRLDYGLKKSFSPNSPISALGLGSLPITPGNPLAAAHPSTAPAFPGSVGCLLLVNPLLPRGKAKTPLPAGRINPTLRTPRSCSWHGLFPKPGGTGRAGPLQERSRVPGEGICHQTPLPKAKLIFPNYGICNLISKCLPTPLSSHRDDSHEKRWKSPAAPEGDARGAASNWQQMKSRA